MLVLVCIWRIVTMIVSICTYLLRKRQRSTTAMMINNTTSRPPTPADMPAINATSSPALVQQTNNMNYSNELCKLINFDVLHKRHH